jgi:signal peptidase
MYSDFKKLFRYFLKKYKGIWDMVVVLVLFILVLSSLYAYTQVWPPFVVIESSSMQHGYQYKYGIINAGDIVIVKHITSINQIQTYVQGEADGFKSYGEYGNVILYHENGLTNTVPIIHRAIIYLIWNSSENAFSAPSLSSLEYNQQWSSPNRNYNDLQKWLVLYNVGWKNQIVNITLTVLPHHSGFITMGDNNFVQNGGNYYGIYDQEGLIDIYGNIVQPVMLSWIVGIAQGYIPWVGSIKLYFDGNANYVPSASWDYLGVVISTFVVIVLTVDYLIPWIRKKNKGKEENKEDFVKNNFS